VFNRRSIRRNCLKRRFKNRLRGYLTILKK
jgi:hypothetical protein